MSNVKTNIIKVKSNDTYSNRIYNYCLNYAATRNSFLVLFFVAFADASFLPLPTPFIFIAMMLLNLKKAYWFAFYGSIGTIAGSLLGYIIGYFLWNTSGGEYTQLANFMFKYIPGFDLSFHQRVKDLYDIWGTWVLLAAPFVPLPYKIFSISSGIFEINLFTFIIITTIGQSIKFYLTSFLTRKFGYKLLPFINSHLKSVSFIFLLIIIIIVILNLF